MPVSKEVLDGLPLPPNKEDGLPMPPVKKKEGTTSSTTTAQESIPTSPESESGTPSTSNKNPFEFTLSETRAEQPAKTPKARTVSEEQQRIESDASKEVLSEQEKFADAQAQGVPFFRGGKILSQEELAIQNSNNYEKNKIVSSALNPIITPGLIFQERKNLINTKLIEKGLTTPEQVAIEDEKREEREKFIEEESIKPGKTIQEFETKKTVNYHGRNYEDSPIYHLGDFDYTVLGDGTKLKFAGDQWISINNVGDPNYNKEESDRLNNISKEKQDEFKSAPQNITENLFKGEDEYKTNVNKYLFRLQERSPNEYDAIARKVFETRGDNTSLSSQKLKRDLIYLADKEINGDKRKDFSVLVDRVGGLDKIKEYNQLQDVIFSKETTPEQKAQAENIIAANYSPEHLKTISDLRVMYDEIKNADADIKNAESTFVKDAVNDENKQIALNALSKVFSKTSPVNPILVSDAGKTVYNTLLGTVSSIAQIPKAFDTDNEYTYLDKYSDRVSELTEDLRLRTADRKLYNSKTGEVDASAAFPLIAGAITNLAVLGGGARLLSGAIGYNAGIVASGFILTRNDYYQEAKTKGLSDQEANAFATGAAALTSSLELVSPGETIWGKEGAKMTINEALERFSKGETLAAIFKPALKEIGKENLQEISQLLGDKFANGIANNIIGRDDLDTSIKAEEFIETIVATTFATGLSAGIRGITTSDETKKEYLNKLTENDHIFDVALNTIEANVNSGLISKEKGLNLSLELTEKFNEKKQMPPEWSESKKSYISDFTQQLKPLQEAKYEIADNGEIVERKESPAQSKAAEAIQSKISDLEKKPNEWFDNLSKSTQQKAQEVAQGNSAPIEAILSEETTPEEKAVQIEALKKEANSLETSTDLQTAIASVDIKEDKIEGRILTEVQSEELQKEIEDNYTPEGEVRFGKENKDIRTNVFNYDNPIAEKTVNGVNLRISEGLIRDNRKTYLLYADGKIVGEFYHVDDIKKVVKQIEDNLVKGLASKNTPIEEKKVDFTGKDNNYLANKEPGFFTPEERASYNELMKSPDTEDQAAKMVSDKKAELKSPPIITPSNESNQSNGEEVITEETNVNKESIGQGNETGVQEEVVQNTPVIFLDEKQNEEPNLNAVVEDIQSQGKEATKENILSGIDETISLIQDHIDNGDVSKSEKTSLKKHINNLTQIKSQVEKSNNITFKKPENATPKSTEQQQESNQQTGIQERIGTDTQRNEEAVTETDRSDSNKDSEGSKITNVEEYKAAIKKAIPTLTQEQVEAIAIQAEALKNFAEKELGLSNDEAWIETQGEIVDIKNTPFFMQLEGKQELVKPLPDLVNGFYSPIEKRLLETKIDKQSVNKWKSIIGQGDEAKWTGVSEWLNSLKPDQTLSKAEIMQHMKDNRIQVVEVVKGGSAFNRDRYSASETFNGNWEVYYDGEKIDTFNDVSSADEAIDEAINIADPYTVADENNEEATKYQNYQTPGEKENYKEILVTLPTERSKSFERRNELAAIDRERPLTESEQKEYEKLIQKSKKDTGVFKSSHFDEPNILVHLRTNIRTDADGKKLLFIEELQSDYGQQGKREGFKLTEKEAAEKHDIADKKYADFMKRMESKYGKGWENELDKLEVEEETKILDERENAAEGKIPKAPFVTDTNSWVKLGLKTAIREAVKEGVDKIAWTTGEQQNDRYDLSKQVDRLEIQKNDDGTYYVNGGKGNNEFAFDQNNIPEDKLADYVGKEIAEKAINNGQTDFRGNDLKVGGKGMTGFYGSPSENKLGIIGQVAESLFGKGSVRKTSISDTKDSFVDIRKGSEGNIYVSWVDPVSRQGMVENFDNRKEAETFREEKKKEILSKTSTQHSIEITPKIREEVQRGLPLFQKPQTQGETVKGAANIDRGTTYYGEKADVSTAIHEPQHHFLNLIDRLANDGNAKAIEMSKTIDNWTASRKGREFAEREGLKMRTPEHRHEFFARSAEKYFLEGKRAGFPDKINRVFDQFKKFLTQIYEGVIASPGKIQLSAEIRDLFDSIYGKEKTLEDLGPKTRTPKEAVKEIKRQLLSHVAGLNMGANQAEGTFISTEPNNRYEDKKNGRVPYIVKVDINNPFVTTDTGLSEMRRTVLNDNLDKFATEDFEIGTKVTGTKYEDDLSEYGKKKLSKLITEDLKAKGYDSIYFPSSVIQEGEVIVFDKNNVTITGTKLNSKLRNPNRVKITPLWMKVRDYMRKNSDTSQLGRYEPVGMFIQGIVNGNIVISSKSLIKELGLSHREGSIRDEFKALKWATEKYSYNKKKNTKPQSIEDIAGGILETLNQKHESDFDQNDIRSEIISALRDFSSKEELFNEYQRAMNEAKGVRPDQEMMDEMYADWLIKEQEDYNDAIQESVSDLEENHVELSTPEKMLDIINKYTDTETGKFDAERAYIELPVPIFSKLITYYHETANQTPNGQAKDKNGDSTAISTGKETQGKKGTLEKELDEKIKELQEKAAALQNKFNTERDNYSKKIGLFGILPEDKKLVDNGVQLTDAQKVANRKLDEIKGEIDKINTEIDRLEKSRPDIIAADEKQGTFFQNPNEPLGLTLKDIQELRRKSEERKKEKENIDTVKKGEVGDNIPPTPPNEEGEAPVTPPEEGIGISKQEVFDRFNKKFEKTPLGWSDMSKSGLNRLREDAIENNTTIEQQAKDEVKRMGKEIDNNRLTVSSDRIIAATTHLINIESHIDSLLDVKSNTPEGRESLASEIENALAERNFTLKVLDRLGSESGRNLGLFAGIFSRNGEVETQLKIARRRVEGAFGMDIPETIKELDEIPATKISATKKALIRPYVQKIENIKADYEKQIAELNAKEKEQPSTEKEEKIKKERKKLSSTFRDLAEKIRKSESLEKLGLGKSLVPGAKLQGFTLNVKELLADAIDFIADGIEKGENLVDLISKASKKYKGENNEDEFKGLLDLTVGNLPPIDKDIVGGPVPFDVKADAISEAKELVRKKTEGLLTQVARQAEYENRGTYDKFLDWRRSFLIGGIKTMGRVLISGVSKFFVDPLVRQTTGRIISYLPGMRNERVSTKNAIEGVVSLAKFKDNKSAIEYVNKLENKFDLASKKLEESNNTLESLKSKYGEESAQYKDYELNIHRKIQQEYLRSELDYAQSTIYKWIHGNAALDTKDLFISGSTDFDQIMGGYSKTDYKNLKGSDKALYVIEAMNRLHGVLKNPSARRALVETYNYKLDSYQDNGIPLTASTRMRALDMAYVEFMGGKYQNSTQLTDYVSEKKREGEYQNASFVKKTISNFLKIALPVAKVPINILKTGIDMSTLGVEGIIRYVYETNKGVKYNKEQGKEYKDIFDKLEAGAANIPEAERQYIQKVMGRGLFGAGLMTFAVYAVLNGLIQYGGEYDDEHKAKRKYKDKNGKWQELDYGQWQINGVKLSKFQSSVLNHLPEFLPISMVVNTYNVYKYEHEYKGKVGRRQLKDAPTAFGEAMKSDVNEMIERTPYPQLLDPMNIFTNLISLPVASNISEYFDTDKNGNLIERKPENLLEKIEMNIGLRKNVKVKTKKSEE